jgi:hypothetical protein
MIELTIENLQRAIAINRDKYQNRAKTNSDFDNILENEWFQALIK